MTETTEPSISSTETKNDTQEPGKVRKIVRAIGAWIRRMLQGIKPGPNAWRGAGYALFVITLLGMGGVLLNLASETAPDPVSLAILAVLLGLLVALANLISLLVFKLGQLLVALPRFFVWAGFSALAGLYLFFMGGSNNRALLLPLAILLLAAILGAGLTALLRTGWANLTRSQRAVTSIGVVVGLVGLAGMIVWLWSDGPAVEPPVNAAVQAQSRISDLALPDPSQPGPFEVETFTYGSGKDLHRPEFGSKVRWVTESVDGSPFVGGWSGPTGWARTRYWGFDLKNLPINGRVWVPKGNGPFPLVLMVHGNHSAQDYSDTGYAYLGELLASRGYIFVSVDENFLNGSALDTVLGGPGGGLKKENDARAWLLLEHLKGWSQWSRNDKFPYYQKVDLEHIALIGHSRGGEAAAIAAAFNRLPAYPDDASVKFNYNYAIRSVIAIAPVDGQYMPSNVGTPLENVNYFTLQGVQDGDMRSFEGTVQYQRVKFTGDGDWFKSYLYIYGANHGQFNDEWGKTDLAGGAARLLNLHNLMPLEEQQQIAKVYISAFLDATLGKEPGYRPLFQNYLSARQWLPDTIYMNGYADSHFQPLATYEEDLNVNSATLPGASLQGFKLTKWREQMVSLKWGPLESKAAYLGWDAEKEAGAAYIVQLPEQPLNLSADRSLIFSLADANEDRAKGETPEPVNFTIEVADRAGQVARLPLSQVQMLQPQLEGQVAKVPWFNPTATREVVMQTYRFPLADFQAINPALQLGQLDKIRLIFDLTSKGTVVLDNLGIE